MPRRARSRTGLDYIVSICLAFIRCDTYQSSNLLARKAAKAYRSECQTKPGRESCHSPADLDSPRGSLRQSAPFARHFKAKLPFIASEWNRATSTVGYVQRTGRSLLGSSACHRKASRKTPDLRTSMKCSLSYQVTNSSGSKKSGFAIFEFT